MLTLPSKHLVSITMVESLFSQTICQKSLTVLGKGPVAIILYFVDINCQAHVLLTLSSYIGICLIVALREYRSMYVHEINDF